MNALIYGRCSTDQQRASEGGISIEHQLERCREYVERRGWTLAGDPIVDEGVSGGMNRARPGFIELLNRIEQGGVDAVVILSLERLSRDMLTLLALEKLLNEQGIELHTAEGCIDTGSVDGFMAFAMKAFMGELERRQVQDRTRKAMAFKKSNGQVVGHIPYGFRREGKELVADLNEQRIIRKANEQYESGARLKDIVDTLNEGGERTRGGSLWTPTQVKRLIADYQGSFKKHKTLIGTAARAFIEAVA